MNEEFDYQAKLGSLFERLNGIDKDISLNDMPIRIGNALYHGDINNLQQILAMSGDGLMTAIAGGQRHKTGAMAHLPEIFGRK